jgi:hypothetical protein
MAVVATSKYHTAFIDTLGDIYTCVRCSTATEGSGQV